jgi:hypothetical protein
VAQCQFCRIGDFMKYSHSKAMAVFYKIVKLVKNGVLMIIYIYAKVSSYLIFKLPSTIDKTVDGITYDVYTHGDANTGANVELWVQQEVVLF